MLTWFPLLLFPLGLLALGAAALRWRSPEARTRLHALLLVLAGASMAIQSTAGRLREERRDAERAELLLQMHPELPPEVRSGLRPEQSGIGIGLPVAAGFLLGVGAMGLFQRRTEV